MITAIRQPKKDKNGIARRQVLILIVRKQTNISLQTLSVRIAPDSLISKYQKSSLMRHKAAITMTTARIKSLKLVYFMRPLLTNRRDLK
jgi:hypothetical protein